MPRGRARKPPIDPRAAYPAARARSYVLLLGSDPVEMEKAAEGHTVQQVAMTMDRTVSPWLGHVILIERERAEWFARIASEDFDLDVTIFESHDIARDQMLTALKFHGHPKLSA